MHATRASRFRIWVALVVDQALDLLGKVLALILHDPHSVYRRLDNGFTAYTTRSRCIMLVYPVLDDSFIMFRTCDIWEANLYGPKSALARIKSCIKCTVPLDDDIVQALTGSTQPAGSLFSIRTLRPGY